jgi:hypothetical protein
MISHPGQEGFDMKYEPQYPKGPAIKTDTWVRGKLGFYKIENITVPREEDRARLKFGCIPGRTSDGRLNWGALDFPVAYVASTDMECMQRNGYTFTVAYGVYWEETWMPFEALVKPFMDEKIRQDWLAKNDPANYNPALREACKLILNSLFGALLDQGENKSIDDVTDIASLDLAGTRIVYNNKILLKSKVVKDTNNSIQYGCFVLAISRVLHQGYMDLIGRHNVIVTETDSFYIPEDAITSLNASTHPVWRLGDKFGNIKVEHSGLLDMMALAKKCYSAIKLAGARDIAPGKRLVHSRRDGTPEKTVTVIDTYETYVMVLIDSYQALVPASELYVHKCAFKGISKPEREDFIQLLNKGSVHKVSQNFSRTLFEHKQRTGVRIGFRAKTARQDSRCPYHLYTSCGPKGPVATSLIRAAPGGVAPISPIPEAIVAKEPARTYTEITNVENARRLMALTRKELAEVLRKEFDEDYDENIARFGQAAADEARENNERGKLSNVKTYCKAVIANGGKLVYEYGFAKIKGTSLRRTNGRLYSIGIGLQGLPGMVRGFLLEGVEAYDHDMKNAHPNIALGIAKEHALYVPALEQYCADRDGFLEKTGASKSECLAMLNRDTKTRHHHYLVRQLDNDFHKIQNAVHASPKYNHIYDPQRKHAKGSYLNQELCVRENVLLQKVLDHVGHDRAYFLAYDGMMLNTRMSLDVLNDITKDWGIKWDYKAHSNSISLALQGQ